ncbi:fumarylacetoacetate hydrolase family protein [Patescibacteria group bacterium AH-259-L05]|nr:fumarylacetoacetate hydrolase family protein [Patescibacteria group bacterium AH-259-L05]
MKQTALLQPTAIRDFIAFEDHIKALRQKRGKRVPDVWYKMPLHYRGNHLNVSANGDVIPWPRYCKEKFDFELELACVIGKKGINISEREASQYIAGYMIMNDWSCRDIQRDEMQGGLGPVMAKPGPSFGPYLITADELPDLANLCQSPNKGPHMRAYVNDELWSEGRFGSIYWSFAQMIAHISQDSWIFPDEILGSGTVSSGCGAELDRWIQPGDTVKLEIEGIGQLSNSIGFPAKDKKTK